MFEYNVEKMAKLAINYAVEVQKDENVMIQGPSFAEDLIRALYVETIKAGGHPFTRVGIPGLQELNFQHSTDEQLQYISPITKYTYENVDVIINIYADYNLHKLEKIPSEKLRLSQSSEAYQELMKIFHEREAKGELKWTLIPYPCHAMAQECGMDQFSYEKFVAKAVKLDTDDPAQAWRDVEAQQEKIVDYLNNVKTIHVVGEDTDLTMSVEGRTWENSAGHKNIPDGEVFTSPVEDSVNGKIRFTYPGIFQGKEIENIYLEIENGKVVKATAAKGQDLLDNVLELPGARQFGEFAIGTNYGITEFTKNMLFDEKIGGTLHMALGNGFPHLGGKAEAATHWDILKSMKSEDSIVYADGNVIYQAGEWKI